MPEADYVLGSDRSELERLEHQHEVWRERSEAVFDRLGLGPGARVLDAGCGPGYVLLDLRRRVGPGGEVWGVDLTASLLEEARRQAAARGWTDLHLLHGDLHEVTLPADHFDLIWMRWVLSFPPDPGAILRRLAPCLRAGGVLVVQDYHHEGIALHPPSAGFRAAVRATRELYTEAGGDPWVGARLPGLLRAAGLDLVLEEAEIHAGGPDSPWFAWADRFFPRWVERFAAQGRMTQEEAEAFRREWADRRRDPDARFFTPTVVTVAGRR